VLLVSNDLSGDAMMLRRAFLASIICFQCASCALGEEPEKWTAAMNMGLHGPVRSQRVTSRKLNPDPRTDPKLFIDTPTAWVVFDDAGRVTEQANAASGDGTIISVAHLTYDPKTGIESSSDGINVWRTERQIGDHGPVEVKTFRNEVLFERETERYDEHGNMVESITYDAEGDVQSRATYGYDDKGRTTDWCVWGPRNQFNIHMADRFDENGDLIQRTYFDESGRTVTTLSLSNGKLTSHWQAADCECSNDVGISFDDVSYFYQTQRDGTIETTVQNHPHTRSNIELTDAERISGNDTVVEKLTFNYERDSRGNWTKRTVFAWDPKSDATIPVQEDLRILTYY
jgi:hypothetical protein